MNGLEPLCSILLLFVVIVQATTGLRLAASVGRLRKLPSCILDARIDCSQYDVQGVNFLFCRDDRVQHICPQCLQCGNYSRGVKKLSSIADGIRGKLLSELTWQQKVLLVPHESLSWLLRTFGFTVEQVSILEPEATIHSSWRMQNLMMFFKMFLRRLVQHHHDDEDKIYFRFLERYCPISLPPELFSQHEELLNVLHSIEASFSIKDVYRHVQKLMAVWTGHLKAEEEIIPQMLTETGGLASITCNYATNKMATVAMIAVMGADMRIMSAMILHTMQNVWADAAETKAFKDELSMSGLLMQSVRLWKRHLKTKVLALLRSVYMLKNPFEGLPESSFELHDNTGLDAIQKMGKWITTLVYGSRSPSGEDIPIKAIPESDPHAVNRSRPTATLLTPLPTSSVLHIPLMVDIPHGAVPGMLVNFLIGENMHTARIPLHPPGTHSFLVYVPVQSD